MLRLPVLAAVLAAAIPSIAPAQAQAQVDSLSFHPPAPLVLGTRDLPHGVVLRTSVPGSVEVRLSFFSLDADRPVAVAVDTGVVTLPAAGTRAVLLGPGDHRGDRWPRRGYLVARAGGQIDTLNVTVYRDSVPPGMVSALPVKEWTMEVRRWTLPLRKCAERSGFLGTTCFRGTRVPISFGATSSRGPAPGSVVGFVTNDTTWRGTASVVSNGRVTLPGGAMAERLTLSELGEVGLYKGSAKLGDATLSDLKVLVTDGLTPALIAIGLGILLATLMQRYATRNRLLLLTSARIAALARDAAIREAEFRAALDPRPIGATYDVLRSARERRDALLAELDALARENPSLTNETVEPVTGKLPSLEAGIVAWPAVGRALARLYDALHTLKRRPRPWPHPDGGADDDMPPIVVKSEELLGGRSLALDAVEGERTRLDTRADLLLRWHALNAEAAEYTKRADDVVTANPDSADAKTARGTLRGEWRRLWEEADFDGAAVEKALNEAEETVRGLEQTAHADAAALDQGQVGKVSGTMVAARTETVPAAPDPRALHRRVRLLDRYFSILAGLVALMVALGQVYYDGPVFGTAYDYLTAFLWAFSVKAGLEVLKTFGERVVAGLPIPRPT